MTNKESLAWAAGFFDGEGYIANKKVLRGHTISITIAQIEKSTLSRFLNAVGKGKIYGPYPHRHAKGRDYHIYSCNNQAAIAVAEKLRPFLCGVKRRQIQIAIEGYNSYVPRRRGPKPLLTPHQVESVKALRKEGTPTRELAFMYKISPETIRGIITGARKYAR